MDQGFDDFFGFTDARHAWEKQPKELWDGRSLKPSQGWANDLFTDRAIDFLKRKKAVPFFLYVPYTDPHFNVEAPPEAVSKLEGKFPQPIANTHYAAMIEQLDRNIGRLLKTLDELKLTENTIVVFCSDHGATFEGGNRGASNFHDSNRPFRGQKRTLWEGGIRVPGIVRWPGQVPAGTVSNELVHNADVLPTLLAAAGAEPKSEWKIDGRNLLTTWEGKTKAPDRTLFWEWRSEGNLQLAAMKGDFKLVVTGNNRPELFDVVKDPAERRNIAAQFPRVAQSLNQELQGWIATERKSD
jgi:arylsulfatase A-like enzyme